MQEETEVELLPLKIKTQFESRALWGLLPLAVAVLLWKLSPLDPHSWRENAPRLLAALLAWLGIGLLLFMGDITWTLDPRRRRLTRVSKNRWSTQKEEIRFEEIQSVEVLRVGSKVKNGFVSWVIRLPRVNGPAVVTGWTSLSLTKTLETAEQFAAVLGCPVQAPAGLQRMGRKQA
jgi:hypothetical protein